MVLYVTFHFHVIPECSFFHDKRKDYWLVIKLRALSSGNIAFILFLNILEVDVDFNND